MARGSHATELLRFTARALVVFAAVGATTSVWAQTEPLQEFNVTQYSAPQNFTQATRIIKGPDGNIWIPFVYQEFGGVTQGYIQQMSPTGQVLATVATQGSPIALTSGPSGDFFSIWFIEYLSTGVEVGRISATPGTAPAVTLEVPIPYQQYASNSLAPTPNAITNAAATNVDNGIYLTDTSNAIIWRVNPTAVNPGPANLAWTVINIDAPAYGIALGPDHNIWFTEYAFSEDSESDIANIAYITPPTSATTTFPLPSPFNTPSTFDAITSGPDLSSVWFSQNQGSAIDSISTSATAGSSPTLEYALSGSTLNDMTLGPDFAVWFTQTFPPTAEFAPALGRIALTDGGVTETNEAVNTTTATFAQPYGIAVGPNNNDLWFTDSGASVLGDAVIIPRLTITPVALPNAVYGQTYSTNLVAGTASGGTQPYVNWQVATGYSLPAGLSLSASSGVISGTPTGSLGTTTFNVTVMDSNGSPFAQTASAQQFSITVIAPLTITAAALPSGVVSKAYPGAQLQAQGGTPPYNGWAVVVGSLPTGLTLNSATGAISGTPSGAPGTSNFTVQVADSGGQTATQQFSITIVPLLTITASTLPSGVVSQVYPGAQLQAQGGTSPYNGWTVVVGSLPTGLTLNSATGAISGTPSGAPGTSNFTVQVADSGGQTATQQFSITIIPLLTITAQSLPSGIVSRVYAGAQLQAQGGTPPYNSWTVVVGSLPTGLTLNSATGAISGTPTGAPGTANFTVQVADSGAQTATQQFSITIVPLLTITAQSLASGIVSRAYPGAQLQAQGGSPPYNGWSVVVGSLPAGLTLNSGTGAISGTPSAPGTSNFTVQVADSGGQTATQQFSITIIPLLTITAQSLPSGIVSQAYPGTQLQAQGGTPPYKSWAVVVGSLPAGLTLNSATGAISGTPSAPGTSNFTVQVADSGGQTATQQFSITIIPLLTITAQSLSSGVVGQAYSGAQLQAQGGTPPYKNWIVAAGALPTGLTLNSGTGAISGTPSGAPGTSNFTVQVADSGTQTATQQFSITIKPALAITTESVPNGTVGIAYSATLAAQNGTAPYSWSVASGALPAKLSLNASTGAITGTPTAAGAFSFTAEVTDSSTPKQTATRTFRGTISLGLTITTTSLPNGVENAAYSATLAGQSGTGPYKWSIVTGSGALPGGLSLNASTGAITGKPTAGGTFKFTVELTDSSTPTPQTATQPLSLLIVVTPVITTTTLPGGTVGVLYSSVLAAENGTLPYSWSLSAGSKLPAGLTLSSAGGISGTPTASGNFQFTVELTDSSAPTPLTAVQALSLSIVARPSVMTTALPSGTVGVGYSAMVSGSGGATPYTWSVSKGALPAGLALSSAGVISGTPTAAGTFPFTVQLTDSSKPTPLTATQGLSLVIMPAVAKPTFTLTGLPTSQTPGSSITNATITVSPASPAAFTGTLSVALSATASGFPASNNGDAGFGTGFGGKPGSTSVTIPAGSTSVAFPTLDPGTVAGNLGVTFTVTGQTPSSSTVTIDPLAPIIEAGSVQITSVTSTGFDVELVATSTTLDLTTATFTFTAAAGAQISGTSTFTADVGSLLPTWFSTASNYQYGGAFSLSIPFTISGGSASAIGSVSVTLTNSVGTSAAVSGVQ